MCHTRAMPSRPVSVLLTPVCQFVAVFLSTWKIVTLRCTSSALTDETENVVTAASHYSSRHYMVVGFVPLNPHDLYRASKQIFSMSCRRTTLVVVIHWSSYCTGRHTALVIILQWSWCCTGHHAALVVMPHWSLCRTGRYAALVN